MKKVRLLDSCNILRGLLLCALVVAILLTVIVRIRLLDFPLERDEGEYAYAGQLMLQHIPPYQQVYNMKLPGVYAVYALMMSVFGQTVAGIHLGLLLVNIATTFFLFFLTKRLAGFIAAVAAAAVFSVLAVSPAVLGMAAHATHFVLLPAVLGFLFLLSDEMRLKTCVRIFLSGFFFGVAFLMKQHGIFFGLFGGLYLLFSLVRGVRGAWKDLLLILMMYVVGVMVPIGITCLWLYHAGVFETFWFWTFSYARQYVSMVSLSAAVAGFSSAFSHVLRSGWGVWLLAGLGTLTLAGFRGRPYRLFSVGFFVFSFFAICPGFYFRPHYFILFLPAVSIAAGLAVGNGTRWLGQKFPVGRCIPLIGLVLALMHSMYSQKDLLFVLPPEKVCRAVYGFNPFPEALEIADYLKEHSSEDAKIAVIGSEPEINFYARRKSATGHIYMYGLMEPQPYALLMQEQLIREIELADPEYIVFVNVPTSWLASSRSEKRLFFWLNGYLTARYDPIGLADIVSLDQTEYYWDLGEVPRQPQSTCCILIYRRKAVNDVKDESE